ncbi:unnamed protein product, partial [Mesorhabditis spiculigera]
MLFFRLSKESRRFGYALSSACCAFDSSSTAAKWINEKERDGPIENVDGMVAMDHPGKMLLISGGDIWFPCTAIRTRWARANSLRWLKRSNRMAVFLRSGTSETMNGHPTRRLNAKYSNWPPASRTCRREALSLSHRRDRMPRWEKTPSCPPSKTEAFMLVTSAALLEKIGSMKMDAELAAALSRGARVGYSSLRAPQGDRDT